MHVVVRALTAKPESERAATAAHAASQSHSQHYSHPPAHSHPSVHLHSLSLSLHHKQVPRAGATTRRQSVAASYAEGGGARFAAVC